MTGVVLNLLCIVVVVFGIHTWGAGIFDLKYVIRTEDVNLTSASVTPTTASAYTVFLTTT